MYTDKLVNAMKPEHSGWEQMRLNRRLKTKEEKAMEQSRKEISVASPSRALQKNAQAADKDLVKIAITYARHGDYQLLKGCRDLGLI